MPTTANGTAKDETTGRANLQRSKSKLLSPWVVSLDVGTPVLTLLTDSLDVPSLSRASHALHTGHHTIHNLNLDSGSLTKTKHRVLLQAKARYEVHSCRTLP